MSPTPEQVPLLPEKSQATKTASVSGAVFNVSTSIIGAGIMSIPFTLKVLGIIPAVVLIVLVAFMTDLSVELLLRFTHSGQSMTYAGVMKESFGPIGSVATQVCVMITNLGGLIMYLIIIGDVFSGNKGGEEVHLGVLQQWFGIQWWNSREFSILFTVVFLLLPLVLFQRVVVLAVVFVAISSVMAIMAIVQGTTKSTRLVPELDDQTSFFELFTAVPVLVTAFTFHFNVHPIRFELRNSKDMMLAVRVALLLCAIIYVTIGIFGYLLFGDSLMSDILTNFDQTSGSSIGALLNDTVRLSYAFHLMLVYPLLNFSLRFNINELLFPNKPPLASDTTRFLAITMTLLAFTYLAAIAFPNIWSIFQFMGSTSTACLAFIFPGAIALRDVNGISTKKDKVIAALMVTLAAVSSIIAIAININTTFENKSREIVN
ncbi:amino acid transporter AVT6C-like isoform X2 [Cucurbita pepo subsp. pepo]|uniref:amino acid transporter AVT6C-like isoform X2 n=1 Tax=Cucurbita pepo subsp. pepo TaxID=3664 RepID=UPI000C9D6044|nr:amino acid transporter AVT6C-like isoform X2 [Cucurbita pepo subsp. pepo]